MNKFVLIACLAVAACSSKPKLEAPPCPDMAKGGQTVNAPNMAPVVSDDGRYTFLRFGMGQEIPAVSALRIDGTERIADHNFNPETRIVTVFGIHPTIVLRSDKRLACIRNLSYDPRSPQSRESAPIW